MIVLGIFKRLYIYLMLVLMLPAFSYAEGTLTLKQSVEATIAHNRQLLANGETLGQAKASVDQAMGRRLPRLDVSAGWVDTNSPLQVFGSKLQQKEITTADFSPNTLNHPSYRQNYQTRLGLSLPLFAGGALLAAQHEAEANEQAASLEHDFLKQKQIYQTIVAYIHAKQLSEQLEISKKSVVAAKQHWQDTKALKKRGVALASDVMHAHVHVLRRQVVVDETSNAYLTSLEQLALLMGSNQILEKVSLSQPLIHMPANNLDVLLSSAVEKRLDFLAMQTRLEAAGFQRKQSYASDLPHVNLIASEEWNSATLGAKNANTMVGVTVSMNLFNGGSDHAKQRSVEYAYNALQWQIADQKQAIHHEIKQAWRALKVAKNKLAREKEALKQTQESLRIQSLRYQQGLETTSHVLDAQVDFDQSQVEKIRAQYDVMVAKAALLLASGQLSEGVVE